MASVGLRVGKKIYLITLWNRHPVIRFTTIIKVITGKIAPGKQPLNQIIPVLVRSILEVHRMDERDVPAIDPLKDINPLLEKAAHEEGKRNACQFEEQIPGVSFAFLREEQVLAVSPELRMKGGSGGGQWTDKMILRAGEHDEQFASRLTEWISKHLKKWLSQSEYIGRG